MDTAGTPVCAGLVLQGGGARGAYQAGVLKAIAEIVPQPRIPLQVISGASVGAINAAALACTATDFVAGVARLERLWRSLHSARVFDTRGTALAANAGRWLMALASGGHGPAAPRSLLNNAPLRRLLARELALGDIQGAIEQQVLIALCITASSYTGGRTVTFFQGQERLEGWQRVRRDGVRTDITLDHILASAALPLAFEAVCVNGVHYGDGGMRQSSPLSPAIRMGAERLVAIGVRDGQPDAPRPGQEPYPSLGELGGHALDILFNDSLEADLERVTRINHTLELMDAGTRRLTGLRPVSVLHLKPSLDIRHLAGQYRDEAPRPVRWMLQALSGRQGNGRLLSYLLFEPGYLGALLDLGYADTLARRDELLGFFAAGP